MKTKYQFFGLVALAVSATAYGASALRVACDEDAAEAEVLINGKFRGQCPVDLQVQDGSLTLVVRKKLDGQRERLFEQNIMMGVASVKKVEVKLGPVKVNAAEQVRRATENRRLESMTAEGLEREAAAGNLEAMVMLGTQNWIGQEATIATEKLAGTWFLKAAQGGHVEAMYRMSVYSTSRRDGTPDDAALMRFWVMKAAEAGHIKAMQSLARRYETGALLPKNESEALRWYRRAAEMGDSSSTINVGLFYDFGKGGVSQNRQEALAWFRKAADLGNNHAMYMVGSAYAYGDGVEKNEEQAIAWWRKAVQGEESSIKAADELKKRGLL